MKTLLFDLDDTLLTNPTEIFLPAYFGALVKEFSAHIDPDTILNLLTSDKYGLMSNQDPAKSLADLFVPDFYIDLGINYEDVREQMEHFFEEKYNLLQPITTPRPEAVTLIDQAIEKGWQIAIATNPVFPIAATLNRLAWAGFPQEKYDFLTVSAYEDYHFAKPNPAYYAEVLAQIGWPEGPVVMIGNDKVMDIKGARDLGLATFWITDDLEQSQSHNGQNPPPTYAGQLDEVLNWLENISEEDLTPSYKTPEAIIAILKSTPAVLHTLTRELSDENWEIAPKPNEWNLTQVTCHLRDVDKDINISRINTILNEENPFITAVDSDTWAEEREYHNQTGPPSFKSFMDIRKKLIEILEDLEPEDWDKPARHTIYGPTTLKELIKITTQHDRLHVQQAHKLIEYIQNK